MSVDSHVTTQLNNNSYVICGFELPKARSWNKEDQKILIASAVSGASATVAGNPLDAIKVRTQVATKRMGTLRTAFEMFKYEGLVPFYRGVLPPTIVKAGTTSMFFTLNGYIKSVWIDKKERNGQFNNGEIPKLNLVETAIVGGFCGMCLGPFISMGEYVKIQLQTDKTIPGAPTRYKNMFDCLWISVKTGTIFRGMAPCTIRVIPGWGVYLFVYDAFNRYFYKDNVLGNNNPLSSKEDTIRVVVGGSLAGAAAWLSSYPPDYVKTLQQSQEVYKWNHTHTQQIITKSIRMNDVIRHTIKHHGLIGFYRGIVPCLLRSLPVNITNFWVYETMLQLQNKYY